jgi:uncharacterized protein
MRWSISQLKKFNNQVFNIDETVSLSDVTDRKDVSSLDEVRVTGEISVHPGRMDVNLNISTTVNMLDSRTSEDIQLPLQIDSLEIFDETVEEDDDVDVNVHPLDHTLDIEPVVRELIVVNIPQVYSKSDEPLGSGKDWEVIDREEFEREKNDKVDPRLEKLKALLDSDEDKEE